MVTSATGGINKGPGHETPWTNCGDCLMLSMQGTVVTLWHRGAFECLQTKPAPGPCPRASVSTDSAEAWLLLWVAAQEEGPQGMHHPTARRSLSDTLSCMYYLHTGDLQGPGSLDLSTGGILSIQQQPRGKHFKALDTWVQMLLKGASGTELQAAHASASMKCCCFKNSMEGGLCLCLSGLLTLVTQLLVLRKSNVCQIPGAIGTGDLVSRLTLWVEPGSLARLASPWPCFSCVRACVRAHTPVVLGLGYAVPV